MRFLFFLSFIFLISFSKSTFSQVLELGEKLKPIRIDTTIGWKVGGVINLNFSQASFTNWAAGGQNSVSIIGLSSLFANYSKRSSRWDNMLDLGYGILNQGKGKIIKTDDKIDFTSKYGHVAGKNWYYSGLLNFKTQFTNGYNYPNDSIKISSFLAPAYAVSAIGMDYKIRDVFTVFIAPITNKTTIVNNTELANQGYFGVTRASYDSNGVLIKTGSKIRNEFGSYVRFVYKKSLFKDKSVTILSKMELFSNYRKNPQNIDVNLENILGFKINKYLSASITMQMYYDDDVKLTIDKNKDGIIDINGPRLQFKQVLGIGFNYKFS
jgi:hypothetical protein